MKEILAQIEEALPWLSIELGGFGDKKFRKQNSLPSTSINCMATKHRYLALFPESDRVWTIVVFTSNGLGSAFFHKRISRPRAKFAVYSFFLEELLEAIEDTLGVGSDRDESSGKQRDIEIQKQIKLVQKAIKTEDSVEYQPETYRISL
jgi:hypothetical protein